MARRAVACFRTQSYDQAKRFLMIWDTGDPAWYASLRGPTNEQHWTPQCAGGATIGALRNTANMSAGKCDIFAHFDSDDISHASRISEQLALLQASGADVVGYREMLFWRMLKVGQAWLYSNPDPRYCIGSSLCYWRASWERHPFNENLAPTGRGEDHEFWRVLKSVGETSLVVTGHGNDREPRMICSIHAGNAQHYPSEVLEASPSWKRVPDWDNHCRSAMHL